MRIVIIVSDGHPELFKELNAIPVSYRADRIRTLATLGLLLSRAASTLPAPAASSSLISGGEAPLRASSPQLNKVRDHLRKTLLG